MWKWIAASLVLLLGVTPASAQNDLENWQSFDFFRLTGGLNSTFDTTALEPDEARDLQNVVLTTGGAILKRQGFSNENTSACGSSSATTTGLAFYKLSDGTRAIVTILSDTSDGIFKMDYGGGTAGPDGTCDDITGSLTLVVSDDDLSDFATVQDVLVIEDGIATTAPFRWNGTGNATNLGGSPPNATMVEFHKRILWLAGRSDARSRVDFSNLDDFETWTSTDFILVETDDGQNITGLKSALDCLYVFKTESIWRICGSDRDNLRLEQMVPDIGASGNQSIQVINNRFIFLTSQGDVAVYDGGLTIQIISSKIESTLNDMERDRFDDAVSAAFDDGTGDKDYYLALSTAGTGTNDTVLVYDSFHQAWIKFKGINANAMTAYEEGSLEKALLFGTYGGDINRYPDTNADDGAAIVSFYESGDLRFPQIPLQKTFRDIQLVLRQQGNYNVVFQRFVDFEGAGESFTISLGGASDVWDTGIWDVAVYGDIATQITRVNVNKVGDFLRWRISNDNADEPFLLRGIRLWMEPTGRLGGDTP